MAITVLYNGTAPRTELRTLDQAMISNRFFEIERNNTRAQSYFLRRGRGWTKFNLVRFFFTFIVRANSLLAFVKIEQSVTPIVVARLNRDANYSPFTSDGPTFREEKEKTSGRNSKIRSPVLSLGYARET